MNSRIPSEATNGWQSAGYRFGESSIYDGKPLVHEKILSDRRSAGGGITYLLNFSPPEGKLIKLIATAESDEHIYILEGG
jgi:hypothetical protein